VTSDNVTIDGVVITSSSQSGTAISAIGTWQAPIRNLTIRNCRIDGFNTAIEARHVENLVIDHCTITDALYGGIMVFSGVGGRITNNTIQRIGYQVQPTIDVNAYGIALSRVATTSLQTDPRSSNFTVSGNVITDIPTWQGLDTHAGSNLTLSDNIIRRTMRPIFITGDSAGNHALAVSITGNRLEQAEDFPGGSGLAAVTLVNLQGGSVTNNAISVTYPTPFVYDYLGVDPAGSTGVTISGQTSIP
jgi:hypothetical protein